MNPLSNVKLDKRKGIIITSLTLIAITIFAIYLGMQVESFLGLPGISLVFYTYFIWYIGFKSN